MKRAILPTVIAWLVGVAFLMVYFCATEAENYWTSHPIRESFQLLMLVTGGVAIVVFPTCLLVVTPLLRLVPRSWPLWAPPIAALVGAAVAPFAMYLWAAAFLRHAFVPNFSQEGHVLFACASIPVGAIFAFFYARAVRNAI